MSTTKEQVKNFFEKCEEIKSCKFIMATTKIKDLLKAIVNSPELYLLFKKVTENYDYLSAKNKCFLTVSNGIINKSYVILPEILGERLAFIFCLLAEFDNGSLNFNKFLQCYYSEDGSYFSSYHAFCDQIICALQEIIVEVYKDELFDENFIIKEACENEQQNNIIENPTNSQLAQKIQEIYLIISKEQQTLSSSQLSEAEIKAGNIILLEIANAVKCQNFTQISALLAGYNYFALYNNCVTENLAFLIDSLAVFGKLL